MDELKDIRWKQRFENFNKAYILLEKYSTKAKLSELEQAGIIQFFQMTFELGWKVLKDYLEADGYIVKSPRETIKQAFQNEIINDGHIWMDALLIRNLTTHTYDENLANKMVSGIVKIYFPELKKMHDKLEKEV
ncbi:nucleotidyltransferase substrate binding protein [Clostridium saccharobutylicum]|uniref:Nucleotidyltransferase substrate binding protein like protein n=1 Tax=Clostridium saccharobutylicum TaxID=169679 RepID=A0A1S8NJB4_CLOSA|nr:nucleotidyltransferase substrate binding protein [Clostridium saccharobutylicum]OOM16540.1 nucleotidyltransferase substrate binding protein like protein [Clostridium saccharobutylicum]